MIKMLDRFHDADGYLDPGDGIIDWWADYAGVEVNDINDIGRLAYRLRDMVQYTDANQLDKWKERMDQCVANEFTEPEPFQEYSGNRLYGKSGRIYITGGDPEGIEITDWKIDWHDDG
jgi:hypothetical protein